MPTTRKTFSGTAHRARYTRTTGDLLKGGSDLPLGINPSGQPPVIWWNGLDSGAGSHPIGPNGPWTGQSAEALPVVTRATGLIVDPIAQSPMTVHELGFGGRPLSTPRWLQDPMLTRRDARVGDQIYPSAMRLTRSKWFGDLIRSALWWGLGAWVHIEDETGQPVAGSMRLIHPGFLSTEWVDGSLRWVIGGEQSSDYRYVADRDGYVFTNGVRQRLMVLRHPGSPVDAEGGSMGVFAMNPGAFRLSGQIDSYASGVFQSGVPSGYLRVNVPGVQQEQIDELRAAWNLAHGSASRRSTAVLNSATEYVPISMSPVDTALTEVQQLAIGSVAYAFNISPEMLGVSMGSSGLVYSNIQSWFRAHLGMGIGIWVTALEELLSSLLPGNTGVKVNLDAFTRPEAQDRYTAYQTAIEAGILTIDEVREAEGLPPLPPPKPEPVPEISSTAPAPVPLQEPAAEEQPPETGAVRAIRAQGQSWRR